MAEEEEEFEGLEDALGDEGEAEAEAEGEGGGEDDAAALEEAMSLGDDAGDGEEDLDPLAEEMLKMMEEDEGDAGGGEDVDQMMEMEMLKAMEQEGGGGPGADLGGGGGGMMAAPGMPPNIERLMDVELTVTIELGRTRQTIEKVMEYGDQSLIELEKTVGEPCDVRVNGELFARGEVVTVSENFGVRITELVSPIAAIH